MFKEFKHKITDICDKIDMPIEVTEKIIDELTNHDFSDIADHFPKLINLNTGGIAVKNIELLLKDSANSLKPLTVYLAAAVRTWERYEGLGISREIFIDTMKMFSRFVREHLETFGFYGFDRDFWIYRILSVSIFRLGTLEFEIMTCPNNETLPDYAKEGEPVISVHIPSDAKLTRENLDNSYAMARSFLGEYFPEFGDKTIFCKTWLLDPALKKLLPDSSGILNFQSDYQIIDINLNNRGFMVWVFKKNYDDYALLPENTTLQKNLKKYLLSGGSIGWATGVFRNQ